MAGVTPPLMAIWFLPVLLVLAGLALSRKFTVRWPFVAAAVAAFMLYTIVAHATLPDGAGELPAYARWASRIAALAAGLALAALAMRFGRDAHLTREGLGLTLQQAPGSIPVALLGTVVLCLMAVLPGGWEFANWPPPQALAYHLTLPGTEEELLYRGLLTSLCAAALVPQDTSSNAGAPLLWGSVLATMVFALSSAFAVSPGGGIDFNPVTLIFTIVMGAVLAHMRLKTGSLLFPAVAHNLLGLVLNYT